MSYLPASAALNRSWIVLVVALIGAGVALGILVSRDRDPARSRAPVASDPLPSDPLPSDPLPSDPVPSDPAPPSNTVEFTPIEPTYVGREVCRECHAENYQLHGAHGHKSTFFLASDPEIAELFVGKSYNAGEPYGTYTYHIDDEGLFARIPEKFGDQPFRLNYALGSPDGAVTLLSLMPDREQGTVAIEHRASWFSGTGELGPTPQEDLGLPTTPAELFGQKHKDRVMHKCVYCHTTRGEIIDQQIADLVPNVNCEKCHGPASEHVRQARNMPVPPKFSVGRDDWDIESEIQLCGDCHRLPTTISRQELRDYPDQLTRFQPVGLLRSRCYVESDGKLTCSTCHNPHQTIESVPKGQHVQNCIDCHQQQTPEHVACPVSPSEGCIECHMPAIELAGLGGIGFHDHWIRVHDEK